MRNIKILHIANDFANSKVHSNLIRHLEKRGLEQIVYCPIRTTEENGRNSFVSNSTQLIYSLCIRSWYKYLYHYKRYILYKDLKSKVDLNSIDLIHASTLFSDGGLAYNAYKEYGIPYVVAVRNTDVNKYMRIMKHTYSAGRKILLNAQKIYFISKGLEKQFEMSEFTSPILNQIKDKFVFRPNGIDVFWHNNISRQFQTGHNILYIGDFTPNKNVCRLIEAVDLLRKTTKYGDAKLIIVGGGRDKQSQVETMISNNIEFVEYKGKIFDLNELKTIMGKCSLFAMPSIYETFGLVYIEALSQNLPLIYTKGQGIDGIFEDMVGIAVNPKSINDICNAIQYVFDNKSKFSNSNINFSQFDWNAIAIKYLKDYELILNIIR